MNATIVTFLLSWSFIILFYLFGSTAPKIFYLGFATLVMWIPGGVALFYAYKEKIHLPIFCKPNQFYLVTSCSALLIAFLIFLLSIPFGDYIGLEKIQPHLPQWIQKLHNPVFSLIVINLLSIFVLTLGMTINMLVALGEELMWRGYLWEKFKHLGVVNFSLRVGFIWGLWYVPLVLLFGHHYPQHSWLGILMIVALTLSLSPLLTYLRIKGQAIIVPAAFHGTLNAAKPLVLILFDKPNLLMIGTTGIIGALVLVIFSEFAMHYMKLSSQKDLKQ